MKDSQTYIQAAVIMAGGSGERFWPLSRAASPKQLMSFGSIETSLLEQTIHNIAPQYDPGHLFITTGRAVADRLDAPTLGIRDGNVLVEPDKRNTAGCLVFTAAHLLARFGSDADDVVMAVFPADHIIKRREKFHALVTAAMEAAKREDALITFGILPGRPETGYGYLELEDKPLDVRAGGNGHHVYPVRRFCEKPDRETAEGYLETGRFFWNSGMFFWRLSVFVRELETAAPGMAAILDDMTRALGNGDEEEARRRFLDLESISIDYALMEKAHRVLAIKADIDWDDVGVWDALDRTQPKDHAGNVVRGEPVLIDTTDSIVYNDAGAENMAVGVVGVDNLAVIVTGDAVLVMPKDRAQDVKTVVKELKKRGAPQV